MKITFHGAARTVTGSQHLLEINGKRILLDCGLFQGKRKDAFELNRQGFCAGASIDVMVLSHAHIDHSGNIPCLVKRGFRGNVVCTSATRDLCAAMLMDSAHLQEMDVEYVNRRRIRNGQKPFEPLYTKDDAAVALRQFVGIGYDRPHQLLPGVTLTLVDAGHMLGSAHVILDIEEGPEKRPLRVLFSGDIGRAGIPIIGDPVPPVAGCDVLIMESTYGDRLHPPYEESEQELQRIVNDTFTRGGSLLIPAFAVGRTQQLVYALHKLFLAGSIPKVPIYVDSPLATRTTEIFRLHPEVYDAEIRGFVYNHEQANPFGFATMHYTQSVEESKALNNLTTPAVIISASGMMEGGRILHHLKNRIGDARNTILVTGWQAPNTLGRRLIDGEAEVKIFGENTQVRARIEVMTGFSGHADRDELLAWAGAMQKKPGQAFVVHGEEEVAFGFAEFLKSELAFASVRVPNLHESFEL
ncbi:MAG: MBL fold metallo-hydrolase [Desulfobulbaceae bacterium]|nr:MBL fold metallo-hydrolase [Desulfobulbaceae bacterium]